MSFPLPVDDSILTAVDTYPTGHGTFSEAGFCPRCPSQMDYGLGGFAEWQHRAGRRLRQNGTWEPVRRAGPT